MLSRHQQFSLIANIKYKSVAAAQSSRNCTAPPDWQESTKVARISWNTTRSSLTSFCLRSEDQQSVTWYCNARASSHCLWGPIYTLSKHHSPSHMSASEHPLTRQLPERKKKSYDILEFPKKLEISTSPNTPFFVSKTKPHPLAFYL